jgi:CheY-like chemotaxis protein
MERFPHPLRIVVAEDSPPMLAMTAAYLEQAGAVVRRATDGTSALALIAEHAPEVVVLDLAMPGLTGFDVLAELRPHPVPPVTVVFTGSATVEDIARCYALGADAVLRKPGLPFLQRAIADALRRRRDRVTPG